MHFLAGEAPVEAQLADEPVAGFDSDEIVASEVIGTEAGALEIIDFLLNDAAERLASDLHLEPVQAGICVRMRIYGMLEQTHAFPPSAAPSLVSRVKVMAKLNITEKRAGQDDRFRHYAGETVIDVRVAIIPTILGEKVTLRLVGLDRSRQELEKLGMNPSCRKLLAKLVRQPHGIILITGPTGSGKTTTLYSAINLINDQTKHIVTIENPVEYNIEGVNQVQVNPDTRITFASALRSILRHDPDVIMVGEMRDYETAHLALEASLTDHLVFATLHTNSACGAITRLLDMEADPIWSPAELPPVWLRDLCAASAPTANSLTKHLWRNLNCVDYPQPPGPRNWPGAKDAPPAGRVDSEVAPAFLRLPPLHRP